MVAGGGGVAAAVKAAEATTIITVPSTVFISDFTIAADATVFAATFVVRLQVLDAVYTTLFFSFGQRASLQQQQQQLTRGASWGLPNRGLPPHFAALRLSGVPYLEGGPFGSTVGPSAAEVEQQDIIWGLIPLGDAVELSVLVRFVFLQKSTAKSFLENRGTCLLLGCCCCCCGFSI